jgi:hypothetical protein
MQTLFWRGWTITAAQIRSTRFTLPLYFSGRLMAEKEEFKIPDFRPWGRDFQFSIKSLAESKSLAVVAVHRNREE